MTTDTMTRDGEIPAIFNPTKRVRTPSVVVTGENGPFSGFTAIPQITHSDSVTSSQHDAESLTCITASGHNHGPETPMSALTPLPPTNSLEPAITQHRTKYRKCKDSCCSELAQKVTRHKKTQSISLNDLCFLCRCTLAFV
jgi:solute carrier family 35, member F3/4